MRNNKSSSKWNPHDHFPFHSNRVPTRTPICDDEGDFSETNSSRNLMNYQEPLHDRQRSKIIHLCLWNKNFQWVIMISEGFKRLFCFIFTFPPNLNSCYSIFLKSNE